MDTEEKLKRLEERVDRLEEKVDSLIRTIESGEIIDRGFLAKFYDNFADRIAMSLTLALFTAQKVELNQKIRREMEEIRKFAVNKSLSLPEAYQEMKKKGILPPTLKEIEGVQKIFKEFFVRV